MILHAIMSVVGLVSGGIMRLAPEVLKFTDRAAERKHELAMQDKALEFERLRSGDRLEQISAIGSSLNTMEGIEALKEAIKGQGRPTGIRWVDALSATVRPVITYWVMAMFCVYKISIFFITYQHNSFEMAIVLNWSEADYAILCDILSFWFLGRVLEKKNAGT